MVVPVSILEYWSWVTETLARAAGYRQDVATEVAGVIARCEEARAKLRKAAALLREPGDAVEALCNVLLLDRGLDPLLLLGPAADLVDGLFTGPGPLAGSIGEAEELLRTTFYQPAEPEEGGPLEAAQRDLGFAIHVAHSDAFHSFALYARSVEELPGGEGAWELWVFHHHLAAAQGSEVDRRLDVAVEGSFAAHHAVSLCEHRREAGQRPGAYMPEAERRLQRTISEVDAVIKALRAMQHILAEVESIVLTATGEAPPPPSP